ncbi:MAG TPA: hypothetical protein VHC22_23625 [Pirellulales bacterium]|nr:hypothetical protein [Pirellulales bacterium]
MHGWRGVVSAGLCVGLLLPGCSRGPEPEQAALIAEIERLGGRVKFDERQAIGEVALGGTQVSGELLARLSLFPDLKTLSLFDSPIGDDDLAQIAALPQLETLYLGRTHVTDAGLARVAGFAGLKTVGLSDTQVSDQGVELLAALGRLRSINLRHTRVSRAGADALKAALPDIVIHL